MPCLSSPETSFRSAALAAVARAVAARWIIAVLVVSGRPLRAQQTSPPTEPPPAPTPASGPQTPVLPAAPVAAITAYRAPVLALVQPPPGALTVPQDKPVVVFRFVQGEAADPVDAATFRVSVDGHDRTSLFQVAPGEAWGSLAASGSATLGAGAHQVSARVCSSRGACGEAAVSVTAVAPATAPRDDKPAAQSRKARVIDLVLQAARRLVGP